MTKSVAPPTCRGYILAHQHPDADPTTTTTPPDPYAVVPCPHPPSIPPTALSAECQGAKGKKACSRGAWCSMHYCGGCKKAVKAARGGVQGCAQPEVGVAVGAAGGDGGVGKEEEKMESTIEEAMLTAS